MKKFKFRLQKVLEYREAMEHWAQEAYLETRMARLEGEAELMQVHSRRSAALKRETTTLDERRELELFLEVMDDEERIQGSVIEILANEESKAFDVWQEKRRELEIISKLREKALQEWQLEETRHEQAELDEWSVMRRGA